MFILRLTRDVTEIEEYFLYAFGLNVGLTLCLSRNKKGSTIYNQFGRGRLGLKCRRKRGPSNEIRSRKVSLTNLNEL